VAIKMLHNLFFQIIPLRAQKPKSDEMNSGRQQFQKSSFGERKLG